MGRKAGTIEQYQKWDGVLFKTKAVKATIDSFIAETVRNGVTVHFRDQELHFDCLTKEDLAVRVCFAGLDTDNAGSYLQEDNTLILGESFKKNAAKLYETARHEFQHKIQHALVQHIDEYKNRPNHYQYLTILKHEIENTQQQITAFDFNFSGHTYISGKLYGAIGDLVDIGKAPQIEYDVAEGLYHMQLLEREAFQVGIEGVTGLNSNRQKDFSAQEEKWRLAFIEYFGLDNKTTYAAICAQIDIAKENIILGRQPNKYNDVALTYKIAALLNAQHSYELDEHDKKAEQYIKDSTPQILTATLQSAGYEKVIDACDRSAKAINIKESHLTPQHLFPYDKTKQNAIVQQNIKNDLQTISVQDNMRTRDER